MTLHCFTNGCNLLLFKVNKEGYVTLIIDLGAGAQTITSEVPVIYNDWIQIQVDNIITKYFTNHNGEYFYLTNHN